MGNRKHTKYYEIMTLFGGIFSIHPSVRTGTRKKRAEKKKKKKKSATQEKGRAIADKDVNRLSIGTTPTLVFGIPFHGAVILCTTMQLLFVLPVLYILTLAPHLGMRQSVQFRYTWNPCHRSWDSAASHLSLLPSSAVVD